MKLKCIAVDDEPLALDLIGKFIQKTPFLSLEAAFDNAIDAMEHISRHATDLAFLDIQMPDLSGMELARILDKQPAGKKPKIVFTTAYDQFAIEGYKVDAMDYLLKPFSYEEFLKAAAKVQAHYQHQRGLSGSKNDQTAQPDYIFLKVEYQLVKTLLNDITHIEGYKDYVKVHLVGKPHPLLSLTSMKNMEETLPADRFMRVHRSFIINLDHIESVSRGAVKIGKAQIIVSENYKDKFTEFLNQRGGK